MPQSLCNHPDHECHAKQGLHLMPCACGCGTVIELHDVYRLHTAPGFGGAWYAPKHHPAYESDQPRPAEHTDLSWRP